MSTPNSANKPPERPAISPETRRRLQQWFEAGTKAMGKGDYKYAEDMFVQCVQGDPGNKIYAQNFLASQHRKYNNNRTGAGGFAKFLGATGAATIKAQEVKRNWPGVVNACLEMLKQNPWQTSTLQSVSTALGAMGCGDTEHYFALAALESAPNDVNLNRYVSQVLAKRGEFDAAINCLNKVRAQKPNDQEAMRLIGEYTVKKTIRRGGYEEADTAHDARKRHLAADDLGDEQYAQQKTTEQRLLKAIEKNPADVSNYRQLADLYIREEKLEQSELVLAKALEASGGDVAIRELMEDIQLRRGNDDISVAERLAKEKPTPENQERLRSMRSSLNRLELQVFSSRSERYPGNPGLRFELGLRLKRAGNYNEAIKNLQEARSDIRRKAQVHLELGESFQQIKQYKLAMTNYREAIASAEDKSGDLRKLALYRAGVLAMGLKENKEAEDYLTELAGLDFSYKDVAQRLEKLGEASRQ